MILYGIINRIDCREDCVSKTRVKSFTVHPGISAPVVFCEKNRAAPVPFKEAHESVSGLHSEAAISFFAAEAGRRIASEKYCTEIRTLLSSSASNSAARAE